MSTLKIEHKRKRKTPAKADAEGEVKAIEPSKPGKKPEKRLNVEILREMHTWFSTEASKREQSIKVLVEDILRDYVIEHDPDRGAEYATRIAEIREQKKAHKAS